MCSSDLVHGTQGMLKTGVNGSGIYRVGESQLTDSAKPLKIAVFDQVENQIVRDGNKSINGVVKYLPFAWA